MGYEIITCKFSRVLINYFFFLFKTYIDAYIRDEVLEIMYYKLSSLPYYYMPRDGTLKIYKDFINSLPTTDHPEAFGQHPNADIASQIQESKILFDTLLAVLPQKTSATVEKEVENEVSLSFDISIDLKT